jgi:hypothetical protein
MIVSFTQTYGNERKSLLNYQTLDYNLNEFKNLFDLNIFSFHNCNDDIVDYFEIINNVKNTKIFRFKDCTYGDCIRQILHFLSQIGCTYLLFIQDDGFSVNKIDYKALLASLKPFDYYSLAYSSEKFDGKNVLTNKDFYNKGFWCFDDTPYLADFRLVQQMYDEKYLKIPNIWKAEMYLNEKYYKENMIKKVLPVQSFTNVNIIGNNSVHLRCSAVLTGDDAKDFIKNRF